MENSPRYQRYLSHHVGLIYKMDRIAVVIHLYSCTKVSPFTSYLSQYKKRE